MRKLSQLTQKSQFRFSVGDAYLTPERHITMSHNPQNMYEDVIAIGQFPLPYRTNDKVLSTKYEQPVLDLIFNYFKSKNPNVRIPTMHYNDYLVQNWDKYNIDFETHKYEILQLLSKEIYVSENKFRYLIEQKQRLEVSEKMFNNQNMNKHMIGYFVERYLELIQQATDISNLYRDPKIRGPESQISLFYQRQFEQNSGISDLEEQTSENQTFINKLMKFIHK